MHRAIQSSFPLNEKSEQRQQSNATVLNAIQILDRIAPDLQSRHHQPINNSQSHI